MADLSFSFDYNSGSDALSKITSKSGNWDKASDASSKASAASVAAAEGSNALSKITSKSGRWDQGSDAISKITSKSARWDEGSDALSKIASKSGIWVFNGSNWTIRNEQHGLTKNIFGHLTFQFIAVDPLNPNIIYAGQNECWSGISAGIFRSTDYGQTWENINFNFVYCFL